MMFCLKCGRMLKNEGGKFVCPGCGWTKDDAPSNLMTKVDKRKEKEIVIVDDTEKIRTLPTTTIRCPECGNNEAEWWLRQLRSADESEVRFFRCTKCEKTWREYD